MIVSINGDTFVTDNPFYPGPFKINGDVQVGDTIAYVPQTRCWIFLKRVIQCF